MKKILSLFAICVMAVTSASAQTTGTAKATIDGKEVEIGWVQLWKDGPKFATRNVGATGTSDKESTLGTTMTFTDAAKTGADYVWGANWKTPSKDEMDLLYYNGSSYEYKSEGNGKVKYEYTSQDDVYGFKFTGVQDGYTNNSLFLPAYVGFWMLGQADYWSSSANSSQPWDLHLNYHFDYNSYWTLDDLSTTCYVRPVLVDAPAATAVTLDETDETVEHSWDYGKTYDITLNRTMKAGRWNTLMIPFDMTNDQVKATFGETAKVMKMTSIENNVVNFTTEETPTIAGGEAYIVEPAADVTKIEFKGASAPGVSIINSFMGSYCVKGCTFQSTLDESDYKNKPIYVLSNNKFYQVDSNETVKGFRWVIYDYSDNNAKAGLGISFDGEVATAIGLTPALSQREGDGKFLQNGKLVIVKDGKQFNAAGAQIK